MKTNNTKKALVLSTLALLLCVSMLVGTTFAWFTDSVSTVNNKIVAGNLDVELYWSTTAEENSWEKVDGNTNVFTGQLWEPGHTEVVYLKVVNEGTLALKYNLGINIFNEVAGTNVYDQSFKLSDYIRFGVKDNVTTKYATREDAIAAVDASSAFIREAYSKSSALESKAEEVVALVVYMPTDVDNEANYKTGTIPPSIDLGINLVATQQTSESDSYDEYYDGGATWLGGVDYSWYDADAAELTIGSAEQLAALAAIVNGTATAPVTTLSTTAATTIVDSFAGQTIKLISDIDLNNLAWTPIGNWGNAFEGTFDGQGHTINNLFINDNQGEGVGLFGVVQNATIKGITLNNVKVTAYSMVAGVVGAAYPANITDCHIKGDVEIVAEWAYVAGIAGYCYYGTQVNNCSVIAADTGLIQSETRNAVGGITAWLLEGDHKVTNCQVKNLNLVGWTNIGGITGFVHYNNTIEGCSVENVTLTKTRVDGNPGIGLIAGGWSYSASNAITLRNNTVNTATIEGTHIAYSAYNELYGSEYGGATSTNFVLDNNTVTNVTNNLIVVTPVETVDGLKAALKADGNYYLKKDLSVTETLTVPAVNTVVLYMNGKTIAGTFSNSGNQEMFLVKGNLTVMDGSFEMTATNNQGWNAMAAIFDVTAGGELNMDGVTASVAGTDMNFIVHLNNWGTASAYINDCDFDLSYVAVRAFNSGYDMNTVTIKNTDVTGGGRLFWVHNYTAEGKDDSTLTLDIYGNNNTSLNAKPVRFGFNDASYYNLDGALIVDSANVGSMDDALLNGGDVALGEDMVIDTNDTTANSGYGATGVSVKGGTLDGNGNSLGINNWGTWDAAVHTTGGTIKNLTVNSGMRGIFMGSATADVYIDNVIIDGTIYTFNSDGGSKDYGVYISNTTLNGWTSHSDVHKEVVYTNCSFGEGSGYAFCRPYGKTVLENCVFEEGFKFDTSQTSDITFINCYYGDTLITAENAATLGNGETTFFYNGLNGITIQ